MRLGIKWLIWFAAVGLYSVFIGGYYYYNLFRWSYDQKLKQNTLDMVRLYAPGLIKGLEQNMDVISIPEYDIVTRIAGDPDIISVLYINRYGEVRWFPDPSMIAMSYDQLTRKVSLPTDAIERAWRTQSAVVRQVPRRLVYDVAVPLLGEGKSLGIIDLQVSRAGINKVIGTAMTKYYVGAFGVLAMLGVLLYFFIHIFVINPLLSLRDAVEAVSFRNMELKYPGRADEIGDAAGALGSLLAKVKNEFAALKAKSQRTSQNEAQWWQTVIAGLLSRNDRVLVVDEDNTVLYTNLAMPEGLEGRPHLLDVIDTNQQDLLRLVGQALDQPNKLVESDTIFKSERCGLKAIYLQQEGEDRRAIIVISPKAAPRAARAPA